MNEALRTQLVAILAAANIDIRLSEDEVQGYPFVTYDMSVYPLRNKDGVYGFSGDTYIRIVSDDFEQADTIRASVESAIESGMGMTSSIFSSRLSSTDKNCVSDIWTIELNYLLKQYGEPEDEETPEEQEEN